MPPKVKITKQEILQTALELVRKEGQEAVNARSIAAMLHCSTQPIFSNFETMEALQKAVIAEAYNCYFSFLQREAERGEYPRYKAFGMAYISFATEEKELFRLLMMRNTGGTKVDWTADGEESIKMIMEGNGITRAAAELMHLEIWACVHGIATMQATSFLSLDRELISRMLSDIYQGLRAKYAAKEG